MLVEQEVLLEPRRLPIDWNSEALEVTVEPPELLNDKEEA